MLTMRPFDGQDDLRAMIELTLAVRPRERMADFPGAVELGEMLARPAVSSQTRLWLEGERLEAWGLVDEWTNIHFAGREPAKRWAGEMLAWAEGVARERGEAELTANAAERDRARIALLRARGFELREERTLHYVRSLEEPLPEPALPPGFAIRPLREDEVEAAALLHRQAFGSEYMTVENRRAMMQGEVYRPEGDLMAVAPDGRLVGYTIASMSLVENAASGRMDGFTDPVAVHPEFRRLGLASALMAAGFRLLQGWGATRARLGTSSENVGMQRAAEAVGYRVESAMVWLGKDVGA